MERLHGSLEQAQTKHLGSKTHHFLLRSWRDLSLVGFMGTEGQLSVVPLLASLNLSAFDAPRSYSEQVQLCLRRYYQEELELAGLSTESQGLSLRWPCLTRALPLVHPEVLDHILGDESLSPLLRDEFEEELRKVLSNPSYEIFHLRRFKVENLSSEQHPLLALEELNPGLLHSSLKALLEALREFHSQIDRAIEQERFVPLTRQVLSLALEGFGQGQIVQGRKIMSRSFSSYLKKVKSLLKCDLEKPPLLALEEDLAALEPELLGEDEGLEQKSSEPYSLVPELPAGVLLEWIERLHQICQTSPIKPLKTEQESGVSQPLMAPTRQWAQALLARELCRRGALALKDYPYGEEGWKGVILRASERFLRPDSAPMLLMDQTYSRGISQGAKLLLSSQSDQGVFQWTLEPAAPQPVFAQAKEEQRLRSVGSVNEKFQSLRNLIRQAEDLDEGSLASIWVQKTEDEGAFVWPFGRVWQFIDILRVMTSFPELFLVPEAIAQQGQVPVRLKDWDLGPDEQAILEAKARSQGLNFDEVDLFDLLREFFPYWPRFGDPSPLSRVFIKDQPKSVDQFSLGIEHAHTGGLDIRLVVRFVETESQDTSKELKALLKNHDQRAKGSFPVLEWTNRVLKERFFEAHIFFWLNGQEISEADWFRAELLPRDVYRLPHGALVDGHIYREKTEQSLYRRKVYDKYGSLRLCQLWAVQRKAQAGEVDKFSLDHYLSQLEMQISPFLAGFEERHREVLGKELLLFALKDLAPTLRPYQVEGVAWALTRLKQKLGICIADEMGLGKTLQTIAILKLLRSPSRPSLVVMPKSLLYNWKRELRRFAPELKVGVFAENEPKSKVDIYLMSYPRLRISEVEVIEKKWNVVVLDEAQSIKNASSQVTHVAMKITAEHRIALTGTPVENKAEELWSILHWLNPGYLGTRSDFSSFVNQARSSTQKSKLLSPVRALIQPIMLRRLKSDAKVALGLPEKVQIDLGCELSEEQDALYRAVLEAVGREDFKTTKAFNLRALYLRAILNLKQICLHPELFYGLRADGAKEKSTSSGYLHNFSNFQIMQRLARAKVQSHEDWVKRSGKLVQLIEMIDSIKMESRGILIFTQYLEAAHIIRKALRPHDPEGIPFIQGQLNPKARMAMVDDFNDRCNRQAKRRDQSAPILILSLKTGGTGLNLCGADRVIHFDRWWNPAVENQASDRAHRIGQDRTVFIHTLTCTGTIEESIARLFDDKNQLASDLLGGAEISDIGSMLKDRARFLSLVDPQGSFRDPLQKRLGEEQET